VRLQNAVWRCIVSGVSRLTRSVITALALIGLGHATASAGLLGPSATGNRARKAASFVAPAWPLEPLTPEAWFNAGIAGDKRYRLATDSLNGFLDRYSHPAREAPDWRGFWRGRYGVARWRAPELAWMGAVSSTDAPVHQLANAGSLVPTPELVPPVLHAPPVGAELLPTWMLEIAPRPGQVLVSPVKVCAPWERTRPVTLMRWGAERDTFRLTECDGSVAPEALDRLSVIARPPGTQHPGLPLPPEPSAASTRGEWLPQVKMLHPRLVWVMSQIAAAFPGRAMYVISGYRPEDHGGYHRRGRALDLYVVGVKNEDLFRVCHTLRDVACGFYPNNKFVHVDVRPFGTGHPVWIDLAAPNEPSRYVDSWPGVVESGGLAWAGEG
jgi:hypothetical protein